MKLQNSFLTCNLLLVIIPFLTGILPIVCQEPQSSPPTEPDQFYISFVLCGRNDEHLGDFLYRLSNTVRYLGHISNQIQEPLEVIVVEWNPLPDRPKLALVLENPFPEYLFLRVVTVPPEIHQLTENFDKIPVHQFIAKNVGIRRARGHFVMATNADVIFGIDFFWLYIKPKKLEEGVFYRADLHMASSPIPPSTPITSWESWLRQHTYEVRTRMIVAPLDSVQYQTYWDAFDIQVAKPMPLDRKRIAHPLELHLSSPGDFLLMAKSQWLNIRGHPEWGLMYGVDTMTQGMCSVLYEQVILPAPVVVYHQWHIMQTTSQGRPKLDANQLWGAVVNMLQVGKVDVFNTEEWGLYNVPLEDVYVGKK